MKKLMILCSCALLLSACGGGGSSEGKSDSLQTVSPQMQEIHKSSGDVKTKSQELNQKADSLLNNI
jgi:hypothetical protein